MLIYLLIHILCGIIAAVWVSNDCNDQQLAPAWGCLAGIVAFLGGWVSVVVILAVIVLRRNS